MLRAAVLLMCAGAVVGNRHTDMLKRTANRCGVTSDISFVNFEETIVSDMPIMYPRDDTELKNLLVTVAQNGCHVRPVGATHSSWKVVTSEEDPLTVGISLAEYAPEDAAWAGVVNVGAKTVKAPAGWSLYQLARAIRPHGLFLTTQTSGAIFSLGGVVTNTVHGGAATAGFLADYVLSLRVAVWTEAGEMETRVITDETELRHWRNSFGLLGVVTGVEFQLEAKEAFLVSTKEHTLNDFTREAVDAFAADMQSYESADGFFDPYRNKILSVVSEERSVPSTCVGVTDGDCEWDYFRVRCKMSECCKFQYKFGDGFGESCRTKYAGLKTSEQFEEEYSKLDESMASVAYYGAPDVNLIGNVGLCALDVAKKLNLGPLNSLVSSVFYDFAFDEIKTSVEANANDVNDGFYLRAVPNKLQLVAYWIPADKLYELFSLLKEIFEEVSQLTGVLQLGNAQFRFMEVGDKATLKPVGALSGLPLTGKFVNCEVVFSQCAIVDQSVMDGWAQVLAKYEKAMRAMDGFAHTGKSFCFGKDANGQMHPYLDTSCISSMFNQAQKDAFQAYRSTSDPTNLFGAGAEAFFA